MPFQNPASTVKWTFLDYTSKTSVLELNTNENLGAVGMLDTLADIQALEDAFVGISGGTIIKQEFAPYVTNFIPTAITNEENQRERRYVIVFIDNINGKEGTVTLPCARTTSSVGTPLVNSEGFANLSAGIWQNVKLTFESVARSIDSNPVTVQYIYIQDDNL